MEQGRQAKRVMAPGSGPTKGWELVIPNRKLKLMDQVRGVLRVKHYATGKYPLMCQEGLVGSNTTPTNKMALVRLSSIMNRKGRSTTISKGGAGRSRSG